MTHFKLSWTFYKPNLAVKGLHKFDKRALRCSWYNFAFCWKDKTEIITGKYEKRKKNTMFQSDQFLYPAIIYTLKYKKTENFYQDKNIKYTFVEKFVERALLWEITL